MFSSVGKGGKDQLLLLLMLKLHQNSRPDHLSMMLNARHSSNDVSIVIVIEILRFK